MKTTNEGWIKIYRQMLEWEWFDDSKMVHIFLYFLLQANTEEKLWRGLTIRRGQFSTSAPTISAATGLSQQQIRTCVKKLAKSGQIIYKTLPFEGPRTRIQSRSVGRDDPGRGAQRIPQWEKPARLDNLPRLAYTSEQLYKGIRGGFDNSKQVARQAASQTFSTGYQQSDRYTRRAANSTDTCPEDYTDTF